MASTVSSNAVTQDSLRLLVEHFSQPIHCETTTQEATPYFDDLLGHVPKTSPIVQHCLDTLLDCSKREWLCGYSSHIRPALVTTNHQVISPGVPVLQQFELVLSQQEWKHDEEDSSVLNSEVSSTLIQVANDILNLAKGLSEDASSREEEEASTEKQQQDAVCRNTVLPTLLRLLYYGLPMIDDGKTRRTCALSLLLFESLNLSTTMKSLSKVSYNEEVAIDLGDWMPPVELPSSSSWNDGVTGIAGRATQKVWNIMCKDEDERQDVLQRMSSEIRAYFFGRQQQEQQQVAPRRPISYPLKLQPQIDNHRPPSPPQIHAAVEYIMLLRQANRHVLENVLPICYALLDSRNSDLGAAVLLHLFDITEAQDWKEYEVTFLDVLERACRIARDGSAVALVCSAQARVFDVLPHCHAERRKATGHLLEILQRNATGKESLVLGLLMGGIVPLLRQHARLPNADAMEMGRLGLTTLLPLLQELNSLRIQAAAIVALMHLIMGAYPIMPRHGGKLMCSLLACLGHASREMEEADAKEQELATSVVNVATRAAALALIMCGERAESILIMVEGESSGFDPMMIKHVLSIRDEAQHLQYQQDSNTKS